MMVPAAVLVLLVLAAIAVDSAIAFLAQRELANTAVAVANDAAGAALSEPAFYATGAGGRVEIDDDAARGLVREALAARAPAGIQDVAAQVSAPGQQICVTLTGRVRYLFARAIPGAASGTTVTGRAGATAVEGPAGTPVTQRSVC